MRRSVFLALILASLSGCGGDDDDDGNQTNAAVETCENRCRALEGGGCIDYDYADLEGCYDDCSDIPQESADCQAASRELDQCVLDQPDVCQAWMTFAGCDTELDIYVNCG